MHECDSAVRFELIVGLNTLKQQVRIGKKSNVGASQPLL